MQLIPEIGVKVSDKLPSETTDQAADMEVTENPTLQNEVDDKLPGKAEGGVLNGICKESPVVATQASYADEVMEVDQIEDTATIITEKQTNPRENVEDDAPLLNDVMVMIADLDQELLSNDNHAEETSKKVNLVDEIKIEESLLASPIKSEKMDCDDLAVCGAIDEKGEEPPKSNEEPISENLKDPFDNKTVTDPAFKDSDKPIDTNILNIPERDNTNVLSPVEIINSINMDIADDVMSINGIADAIEIEISPKTPPVINSSKVNTVTTNVSFEISDDEIDVIKKEVDKVEEEKIIEDDIVVKENIIEADNVEVAKEKVIEDDKVEDVEKIIDNDKVEIIEEKIVDNDKVEIIEEKIVDNDKVEIIEEKIVDNDKVKFIKEKVIEDDTVKTVKDTNEKSIEHDERENKSEQTMCIDDDDDDIVLIDDSTKGDKTEITCLIKKTNENDSTSKMADKMEEDKDSTGKTSPGSALVTNNSIEKNTSANDKEICPWKFMKEIQPALGDMARVDFEEFCVVKVVEGIAGRSALSDLRLKLKSYEKSMEEWRKKVINLNKQNKDLQIVLKTVCDEQQKRAVEKPVPIKITRSVGLQVGFPTINKDKTEQINSTQKGNASPSTPAPAGSLRTRGRLSKAGVQNVTATTITTSPIAPLKSTPAKKNSNVPTPRLVPTTTSSLSNSPKATAKTQPSTPLAAGNGLLKSALSNDVKPNVEKRSAIQSIDLTDDEPPAKQAALKTPSKPPQQAIRAVNTQQLTNANPRVTTYVVNAGSAGPRQVFIPISAQGQPVGPNTMMVPRKMLANKNTQGIRNFGPLSQQNQAIRIGQAIPIRPTNMFTTGYPVHPAPLPQSVNSKALMNSGFKWIPPKPSLKIARVDNGIVISWEMEDFSESQHEVIASYQIYAYQEASTQPSTDLWKKIGDVKALPLPMACTLTHFMAGFKYYFAVRAIDIHRRVGPFSSPGNIMLLSNKSLK